MMGKVTKSIAILMLLSWWSLASAWAQEWSAGSPLVLQGEAVITFDQARGDQHVVKGGRVLIQGTAIKAVLAPGEALPAGFESAVVIDTQGVIVPGFINLHNHIAYNSTPIYEAPYDPEDKISSLAPYENRDQWTSPQKYTSDVKAPFYMLHKRHFLDRGAELVKYAEMKAIVGGTTAVQGSPPDAQVASKYFKDILIRNLDMGLDHNLDGMTSGNEDDMNAHALDIITIAARANGNGNPVTFLSSSGLGATPVMTVKDGEGLRLRNFKQGDAGAWVRAETAKKYTPKEFLVGFKAQSKADFTSSNNLLVKAGAEGKIMAGPSAEGAWKVEFTKKVSGKRVKEWVPEANLKLVKQTIKGWLPATKIMPNVVSKFNEGTSHGIIIHLAEGIDDSSREEFEVVKAYGLLRRELIGIHCTALLPEHFQQMAEVGATCAWSPLSNRLLYKRVPEVPAGTTNIPAALKAGLRVTLASDWSPSGAKNVLGEMKVAELISNSEWDGLLTPEIIVRMATVNPAEALQWDNTVGRLKSGMLADIAVFDSKGQDPYNSIVQGTERNVQLVLVGGDPLYGDDEHMLRLKGEDCETLYNEGGREKKIDVTKEGIEKGDQTLAEIVTPLKEGMANLDNAEWLAAHIKGKGDQDKLEMAKTFISKRSPHPMTLDPIFHELDPEYFARIKRSPSAGFQDLDLQGYYDRANQADEATGGGIDTVVGDVTGETPADADGGTTGEGGQTTSTAVIGNLPSGWKAHVYKQNGSSTSSRIPAGTKITVLGKQAGRVKIRTADGVEGYVHAGWVVQDAEKTEQKIDMGLGN